MTQTGSKDNATKTSKSPLLDVQDLCTFFPIRTGILGRVTGHTKAVNGVNFHINEGETLGLVGESGCGKTTVGRTILKLIPATSGKVLYKGSNLFELSNSKMRSLRKELQIIFQDPFGSLSPRMTIEEIVGEGLRVHYPKLTSAARDKKIKNVLGVKNSLKLAGFQKQIFFMY